MAVSELKAKIQVLEELAASMKSEMNFLLAILQHIMICLPPNAQQEVQDRMKNCNGLHVGMNSMYLDPLNQNSFTSHNIYSNIETLSHTGFQSEQGSIISAFVDKIKQSMHASFCLSGQSQVFASSEQLIYHYGKILGRTSLRSDDQSSSPTACSPLNPKYILPDNVTATDVIRLWKLGAKDIPPIRLWTSAQKLPQKSKISRWRKLVRIFDVKCKGDIMSFMERYTDAKGRPLSVSAILNMHSNNDSISDTETDTDDNVLEGGERKADDLQEKLPWQTNNKETSGSSSILGPNKKKEKHALTYILPSKISGKKVTARDVIRIWNKGLGHIPPIKHWPSAQKLRQQSKISRWKKIVAIYREDFKGSFREFQKRLSDSRGKLLPVSAILSIYNKGKADSQSTVVSQSSSLTSLPTSVIVSVRKEESSSSY